MCAGDPARRQHGAFLLLRHGRSHQRPTTPSARKMFTGGLQRGLHQLNGFITRAQFGCDCRDCGGVSAAAVASALKGQEHRATVCPPVRAAKEAPAKETPTIAPPANEPDEALARRCQPELTGGVGGPGPLSR